MRRLHSVLIGLLCALAVGAQGQPAGALQFSFNSDQSPLWDFSGDYSRSNGNSVAHLTLAHEPNGKLTGSGSADFVSSGTTIHATEISSGRVSGVIGKPVKIIAKGSGQFAGSAQGLPLSGTFRGDLALALDSAAHVLSGRESATLCFPGGGCRTVSTNSSFPLPSNMDGSWSLELNLTTTNKIIHGGAIVTLSTGRIVPLDVRGSAAMGGTRLRITGASGGSFIVKMDAGSNLKSINGRFFGQKIAWRSPI
jgi:hypothetical protein